MTEAEKNVIQRAAELAEAVVAGNYNIPKPMTHAINLLQDAVYVLLDERNISVKDLCSKEFLDFKAAYQKEIDEKLKSLASRLTA